MQIMKSNIFTTKDTKDTKNHKELLGNYLGVFRSSVFNILNTVHILIDSYYKIKKQLNKLKNP